MQKNDLFTEQKKERISSPEQLNRYIKIVTPGVGVVLATMIIIVIGALSWGFMGSIPLTVDLSGAFIEGGDGVFDTFICVADTTTTAQLLSAGMEAQVSPGHAPRDDYGYITGSIESVSTYPVSDDEVLALVDNAELTRLIMPDEPGNLITIKLQTDPQTGNGLKWTHANGSAVAINAGTLATALIVIKEQRPIDLVLEGEA